MVHTIAMTSTITQLGQSRVELKISVPTGEFQSFVDAALKDFTAEAEFPGFRKGKAPAQLVQEKIGEFALYEHAAKNAAMKFFADAVTEHSLDPIGKPDVEVLKLAPGNSFEFKAVFFVMPDVKLPNYRSIAQSLKPEYHSVSVSEDKVQEALAWLQKSRRTYTDVSRPAQTGDRITCDFTILENSKHVEHETQKDFMFVIGEARVLPGFEEKIIGAAAGITTSFTLTIPDNYWNKDIAGKIVNCNVVIKKIGQTHNPILDDAFAKSISKFETMDALRANIAKGLEAEEKEKEQQRFRTLILKRIDEKTEIDTPALLVEREQDMMVHELRHAIEETGIDWRTYMTQIQKTEDEIRNEFASQAKDRVRFALILDAIAKKQAIEPTKEEIEQEANKALARFKNPQEAEKTIDVTALISYTKSVLINEKVSRMLENIALGK
ncbi:MAG: trigger factor [Candidatus Brennerbacteria bacterium CG11_big_fil_rev_8_21_14_0_20_43_10]|uniref:Trigger factor n=3 Tax=Candidatus Brenneribacteriota TaxID=1817902 RepID=A0A2M8C2M0_9BACT|nr:MAG: trigger factor [Parcubacteria group bacterium CG1_02_44_31]PIP50368.1 MAG: trigger factor [Candidatus Brennerbacteria bacterium CG23_combo_of_CG06-09_8_20_14_all_44_41]PIR26920.1 MAG: trigger factor [Candidatus Brennerbacteria bacterium CG11_big_fil_rev_8_21_14_0_20_43_10]PIX28674.1 MAG: trigger factor [Candidatus Brennerbacteria bacterium CG_4_8_14_3_um_filter_43_14]PJA19052.1 MAG: trigger factor [Candidatus Brennerbacteria bacterium CG_4_10_14_0_2_um_filter_43_14]PJB50342.1 MAG: trig